MSGQKAWYRRSTWTARDREEFDARLARSRGDDRKAQYLRLQAYHLHETGDARLLPAALELLDRLISDFPEPFQLTLAFSLRAEVLIDLGQPDAALASYEHALTTRRSFPKVSDDAYLGYVELILALKRHDLYPIAQRLLDEFPVGAFPIEIFRDAAARALLAVGRGEVADARKWAHTALAAAERSASPFRYHRRLGLVRDADPLTMQQLKALAR
jgi:tetratricopeptide (TPR) repeat protein